ncbi:MAG: DUF4099 domain-containing protein [Mucilaginibacter sp.]
MNKPIYTEDALPMSDLEKVGLAENGELKINKEDLDLLLQGRRTQMLRLQNLVSDGLRIQQMDAKLSLKPNAEGQLDLLVHPIYKEAQQLPFLTDSEVEGLIKGKVPNIEKAMFDDDGNFRDVLIEFDRETKEFIVTDEARILVPDRINGEYLSLDQKERYRKGKEVELADGTKVQFSATDKNGIKANKLMLVASLLMDGGLSFFVFKALHWHFGDKKEKNTGEHYSKGYFKDLAEYEKQEQGKTQKQRAAQQPDLQYERSYKPGR